MYCIYCGKEIGDGDKFCMYCGKKQPTDEIPGVESDNTISDKIDNAGDYIGNGIDEALNDLKSDVKAGGEALTEVFENAGQKADDIKKNWRDYLTFDNMESFAALSLLLPVFMAVINGLISSAFYSLSYTPGIGVIFRLITELVRLIFIAVACAGFAAIIYLLSKRPEKRSSWSYIHAGCNISAIISCLGIIFQWKSISLILGAICVLYGIGAISRVVIQKQGIESQPVVGKDLNAYKLWYGDYKQARPTEKEADMMLNNADISYFDGSGISLFGLYLLTVLVSALTCGIAFPWMLCRIYKWRKTHTVINGRRLDFNGTGGSLIGHWIIWELLTLITCGIYAFFVHVALEKWEMQHTFYADQPGSVGQFDGNSFEYFGYGLLSVLLLTISCGLAFPWINTIILKWEMRHTMVASDQMQYDGTAIGILGQYILVAILTIITLGIYAPWGTVRLNRYIFSHTHVDKTYID